MPLFALLVLQRLRSADRGASLVEYALLVGLIALIAVVSVRYLGSSLESNYSLSDSSLFK